MKNLTADTLSDLLSRQHQELETQFSSIEAASRSGDWRECNGCWDAFSSSLVAHMAFEERSLFPLYEESSAEAAIEARGLRAEHDEIRQQIEQLGCDIQMHHAAPPRLAALIASLRKHAHREDTLFHPWLKTAALDQSTLHKASEWWHRVVNKAA